MTGTIITTPDATGKPAGALVACVAEPGAPSRSEVAWHQTDWSRAHDEVRRLQARIAKATQEGRWGKVKALQHLLTRSHAAKLLAVRRVTENRGKKTPGVDGETWSTPDAKSRAVESLRRHGYQPRPLRRIYIPKSNGKMRPLGIPTMKDRAMQALYRLALDPVAETLADPNSYGFRTGRSTADAIAQCFKCLAQENRAEWILEGDIKGCFDHISHEWLLEHVRLDKDVLRKWLKAGFIEKDNLFPTEEGTPQGGIISPVLANIALDGLERVIHERFKPRKDGGHMRFPKVNFVRYADDFIITGVSRELLENEVKPLVEEFLAARGLVLSQEKTNVTHINEGFDFLGQNVRKYDGTLLITPSKKNVASLLEKVRVEIRENRTAKQSVLVGNLNPIIRGWANYHRHVASKRTFAKVDHLIWRMVWQWCKRRHPRKPREWVIDRYFTTIEGRKWMFSAGTIGAKGQQSQLVLVQATATAIFRHTKIHGAANPYDPAWYDYFEERAKARFERTHDGIVQKLWRSQGGKCPICRQTITVESGWHKHHIVTRQDGGSDEAENQILVHQNCHTQIHSPASDVGWLGLPLEAEAEA